MKRHKRLSEALCEAVEFGVPTEIRLDYPAFDELIASLGPDDMHKLDLATMTFENVPYRFERGCQGCVVEHDNRYTGSFITATPTPVPETVVLMRDTRKPAIIAWS